MGRGKKGGDRHRFPKAEATEPVAKKHRQAVPRISAVSPSSLAYFSKCHEHAMHEYEEEDPSSYNRCCQALQVFCEAERNKMSPSLALTRSIIDVHMESSASSSETYEMAPLSESQCLCIV